MVYVRDRVCLFSRCWWWASGDDICMIIYEGKCKKHQTSITMECGVVFYGSFVSSKSLVSSRGTIGRLTLACIILFSVSMMNLLNLLALSSRLWLISSMCLIVILIRWDNPRSLRDKQSNSFSCGRVWQPSALWIKKLESFSRKWYKVSYDGSAALGFQFMAMRAEQFAVIFGIIMLYAMICTCSSWRMKQGV